MIAKTAIVQHKVVNLECLFLGGRPLLTACIKIKRMSRVKGEVFPFFFLFSLGIQFIMFTFFLYRKNYVKKRQIHEATEKKKTKQASTRHEEQMSIRKICSKSNESKIAVSESQVKKKKKKKEEAIGLG